jgi:citryl-CoA synthetase large subunit
MKLKEFEGKQLLESSNILVSKGILVTNTFEPFEGEKVLKVQTLAGGRGKAGGIKVVNFEEAQELTTKFLNKEFLNETITEILLDEKIEISHEYYLGIMFDTSKRKPILIFSEEGGVNIEDVRKNFPEKVIIKEIDYLKGIDSNITTNLKIQEIITKLYDCFVKNDCRMIEINPLVETPEGKFVAVDCVAVLDDDARYRWPIQFEERTDNRKSTKREITAHDIDRNDHRGVAGKTFIDLDGDIAILTSGGGATMTLMDALIQFGGKPANFTEYSGNPPQEKVEALTRIVLDKENLSGLLVAGVVANFTNIYKTLQGVLNVLIEKKPKFPIVIRRAGPHDEEAKEALMKAKEEHSLDIHYFDENTAMTEAAKIMVELSEKYKKEK